jgi:hypothetical protein
MSLPPAGGRIAFSIRALAPRARIEIRPPERRARRACRWRKVGATRSRSTTLRTGLERSTPGHANPALALARPGPSS